MVDNRLALMCGSDIPFDTAPVILHQPKLKEIAMVGEKPFFGGVQYLIVDKDRDVDKNYSIIKDISNYDLLLNIIKSKEQRKRKENIEDALKLLFPNYSIAVAPSGIFINSEEKPFVFDHDSFGELQNLLKEVFCLNRQDGQQLSYNPVSERGREIAEKLMKGREKVAKLKGEKNGGSSSIFAPYMSVISVALGMPLSEVGEMTIYQIYDILERYMLKLDWDIDLKARLAGGKPEEKPENWMKNIH